MMTKRIGHILLATALTLATSLTVAALAPTPAPVGPLAVASARVTIDGTSNIHAYTASTSDVQVTRAEIRGASADADFWSNALTAGADVDFEVAIAAATLTSPREGLDKNMHKALKVQQHPSITFRFVRLEAGAAARRLVGKLTVAGVEREIALDVQAVVSGSSLSLKGRTDLLMTDFGITPPKAMLGMLKTDPKVTIAFETVLAVSATRTEQN